MHGCSSFTLGYWLIECQPWDLTLRARFRLIRSICFDSIHAAAMLDPSLSKTFLKVKTCLKSLPDFVALLCLLGHMCLLIDIVPGSCLRLGSSLRGHQEHDFITARAWLGFVALNASRPRAVLSCSAPARRPETGPNAWLYLRQAMRRVLKSISWEHLREATS